jgi:Fe-S-cluster containining protein
MPQERTKAPASVPGSRYLSFRCSGCGNCCKEPLLPLTDGDVRRISNHTGHRAEDFVQWVDRNAIDMDDEPEAFVALRQGKRVMILKHQRGQCVYLGADDRCTIYSARPLGCRIYPFDPSWKKDGSLRRLTIVRATECPHEMDGHNDVGEMHDLDDRYQRAHHDFNDKVAKWNAEQKKRKRAGKAAETARRFLAFLGVQEWTVRVEGKGQRQG